MCGSVNPDDKTFRTLSCPAQFKAEEEKACSDDPTAKSPPVIVFETDAELEKSTSKLERLKLGVSRRFFSELKNC